MLKREKCPSESCFFIKNQSNNKIAGVFSAGFVYPQNTITRQNSVLVGHLEASRRRLYYSIKLQTVCIRQYLLSTQQLAEYIYTLIYSLSTTNYPLENETYGHKRDSFAAALAHNGIVEPRFPVLHDWCERIVSSSSHTRCEPLLSCMTTSVLAEVATCKRVTLKETDRYFVY